MNIDDKKNKPLLLLPTEPNDKSEMVKLYPANSLFTIITTRKRINEKQNPSNIIEYHFTNKGYYDILQNADEIYRMERLERYKDILSGHILEIETDILHNQSAQLLRDDLTTAELKAIELNKVVLAQYNQLLKQVISDISALENEIARESIEVKLNRLQSNIDEADTTIKYLRTIIDEADGIIPETLSLVEGCIESEHKRKAEFEQKLTELINPKQSKQSPYKPRKAQIMALYIVTSR